ncbi:MAG: AMP-binding protein [Xanthobacteraceae bacterium]|nr:AMP-binding protein [Xanthobacteraceae bacterium]
MMAASAPSGVETLQAYEDAARFRPWLKLQGEAAPAASNATALDVFRAAPRGAPALFYFDTMLSYGDLDDLSDRLAGWLATRGIGRGDRVAVILQNTPQFVIATVATWKLGAVVVGLNPMYRKAELEKLFADCAPRAIICHDDQWQTVVDAAAGRVAPENVLWTSGHEFQRRNDARVLPPDAGAAPGEALSHVLVGPAEPYSTAAVTADDVGLLLYTSGTTGVPKGAMLTHRNLVHNARLSVVHFGLCAQSRIFGVAPLFHVTGFELQLLGAFAAGAAQVLTYRFQPAAVLEAFLEHRPTFIIGAITAFIALMNHPDATSAHFASFDRLYSGGAPIAPAVVDAFAQRFGRSIRSSYGMTELTAPSHLAPADGAIPVDPQSGALSIGIPTPGTDVIVVDDTRRPLGPGEHGEVVVRGPTVMAGYWGKPTETAEVLIGGWMHTGDIGFVDAEGWFYLVDRKKDMISASGFKVWPREVEDVLYAFPGVREAAVVGAPDAYRGETVIAFVSPQSGVDLDAAALIRFCRDRLAAYKCPTRIDILPELPKTASGKITRNVLKQDPRPPTA